MFFNSLLDFGRAMPRLIRDVVMGDYNYEAHARDIDLYSITSSEYNAFILRRLRNNDDAFIEMDIAEGDGQGGFYVREGDDVGWLGYFIGKSTRLESLLISHLPGEDSFRQGLAQNQSIRNLIIWKDLGSTGFQSLCPFFQNTNTLEDLDFSMPLTSPESAQNIALLLRQCQIKSLKRLVFEENGLIDEGFEVIACALRAQPQLEELSLSFISSEDEDVPFDQRGYVALGATMKNWTSPCLNKLRIHYSDLDDDGLLALVEGMANCVNLEHLNLRGNRSITEVGLKALSSLFRSKKFCLQSLDVGDMIIGNEEVIALAPGLMTIQSLKTLNLSHNDIGDEDLEALAVCLSNNKNLETLDLWENRSFSAIGLRCLSDVIPTVLNLKELVLRGNSINDEGLQALAVGLKKHPALERLNLSDNAIGSKGMRALAATKINSLRWLYLDNNAINDEALGVLVEGAEDFNLEILDLARNNNITSSGVAVLSRIFRHGSCSLKHIDLSWTNIEDSAVQAFAEALVGNESLTHLFFGCANVTASGWSALSTLLCDTSSVNNIYLSNHTLGTIGCFPEAASSGVQQYLWLNSQSQYDVPTCKILMSHWDLDMTPLLQWRLKLLPHVLAWFERARSCRAYLKESIKTFKRRKLSAVYQFIRGLPLLAASGFYKRMSTAEGSKKRKFDHSVE